MAKQVVINSFSDDYAFLSNFYPSPITHLDLLFPNVEGAFQASKTKNKKDHRDISKMQFGNQSKKAGQLVTLRDDWEDIKIKVMRKLIRKKFEIPALRIKLVETGKAELIEGNYWKDVFWGVCNGEGKNMLGKILMKERSYIEENYE